jgi:hypothetical protein
MWWKKKNKEHLLTIISEEKPVLKINRTVVSKEFLEKFKSWDEHLASENLIIIK